MPARPRYARLATFVAALLVLLAFVPAQRASAQVTLQLQKRLLGAATVPSGQAFTYRLLYNCASTTQDCLGAKIEDILPAELSGLAADVQVVGNGQTTSATYNAGTRKVSFTFVSPLSAGSTGELRVVVKFPNGTTPNGTTTTNTASFSATNAATTTATAPVVTATASAQASLDKVLTAGNVVGGNFQYRLRFQTASTGSLDYQNVVVTDVIPVGAVFVSASNGGTYDAPSRTVTWPAFNTSNGANVDRTLTVQYPDGPFASGQMVTNQGRATGTPVGGTPQSFSDNETHTLTAPSCTATTAFSPITPSEVTVGYTSGFRIRVRNTGNIPLSGYVVTQNIPAQVDATRFYARGDVAPVRLDYTTNLNGSFRTAGTYTTNTSVQASSLGLVGGEYVTSIRYTFLGELPVAYDRSDYGFDGTVLAIDRTGAAVATPSTIAVSGSYGFSCGIGGPSGGPGGPGTSATVGVNGSVSVVPPSSYYSLAKDITAGGTTINPGGVVDYRLRVGNQSYATDALVNPVIADLLDARWEYVAGSASVAPLEVVENYNGTGRTLLRWAVAGSYAAGQTTDITFQVRARLNAAPGTIRNTYYATQADNPRPRGSSGTPDTSDLDRDGNTTETIYPSNNRDATIATTPLLESRKWVKGSLDTAYSRYPDVGETVPGGLANYRLVLFNSGNVPMTGIKIVDILPFVGDVGVVSPGARGTQWRPNLIGPVAAPAGVVVSYSTEQNPCRTDLNASSPAGCTGPVWSTTPPADITSVQSLKFDFGSRVLASRDSLELTWEMRAPVGTPPNLVAWNSFGYMATRGDGGGDLLPSEPIKVGIKVNAPVPADYGDFVWDDLNANGIQDAGEKGINGVRVELVNVGPDGQYGTADDYPATDNSGNQLPFTLTGNDQNGNPGYYLFPYLQPGTYVAKVFPPTGYEISPRNAGTDDDKDSDIDPATGLIAPRTLAAGQFDYSNDAGLYRRTSLGDFFWHDLNGNGVQDAGEPGIGGVTVTLYNAAGVASGTTTTAANGSYTFDNLIPSTYSVGFSNVPAGFVYTGNDEGGDDAKDSDADRTTGRTPALAVNSGVRNPTFDAGVYRPASLGDYVWHDLNGNGVQDAGEPPVQGVTVTLYNAAGVASGTTTTDANGLYAFTGLRPGAYSVGFSDLPAGFVLTAKDQGGDDAKDSDADATTGKTAPVTLASGDNNTTLDAGLYRPATLGDFVWVDANGNGVFDAGEAPVPGVTVTLYNAGGTAVGTKTTDASGLYLFTGLRPGTYTVGFSDLPADFVFTAKDQGGDDAKDSDADRTTGRTAPVTLVSGDDNRTVDAGIYKPAVLGDRVFDDANGDGIQQPGEGGVGGVTVTLYAANGTTVLGTKTTDANGNYLFTGLAPGTYVVGFSGIPAGKILTNANVGDDRYDSDADRTTGKTGPYTLASGDVNLDVDAGISPPGADLSLTKSVLPVVYAKGQTLTYSVTVRNAGPLDATNVYVTDILPRGLDGPTGSATNGSIAMRAWPDTSRWVIPAIAAGDSATWTVSATLITRDAITNVAEIVKADQFDFDSTPGNHDPTEDDQASVTVTAGQSSVADLSVEKVASRTHVTAGDPITFNIYLRNIGPAAGTNVTVLDALPAGLSFVSATTSTGSYDASTGLWTLPTIARNTRERLTIVATFTGTAPVRNTAQVQTSDQHDPDSTPGNGNPAEDDQSSVIVGPGGGASSTLIDVSLTKTASAQTVAIGQTVTYTVVARNAGPATATGVVVRDLLPAGLDFVSATQTTGGYTPSTGLWPVGTLTAGQSETLTITARVTASGVIVNTAEVTAHDQIDRDSTPGNGNANEDDQASAPVTGGSAASADLSVHKTVSTPTPRVGDVVTYTVNVSNAGPAGATGVVVRDVMPVGLAFVQFTGTPTATVSGQTITWTVGSLAVGQTVSLVYQVRVSAAGSYENVAEVTHSDQPDPDSTPNNGNPAEDDQSGAPITTGGTSGGGTAGVESDGSMASILARRLMLRREDVQARAALLDVSVVPFDASMTAPSLSLDGTVTASQSGIASVLRQIVPTSGPQQSAAMETTPGDLVGVTNAREVVATDFVRTDGRRLAALFGATSPNGVLYDHTKNTCDRLGGGRLDYVKMLDVNGQPFVMSKLVQATGEVDYAVSFVAYRMASGYIVESRFASAQYAPPAGTQEVLNLQVWSVSPEYTAGLVADVLARLRTQGAVEMRTGATLPSVYVVDGRYEGGQIRLRLRNTTGAAMTVPVEGQTATTEGAATSGQRQSLRRDISVPAATPEAPLAEVTLAVGSLFDGTFTLATDASRDQFYVADGTWGQSAGTAAVTTFTTTAETRAPAAGTFLVERNARIAGTVTDYASLFRFLRAGGAPLDLGGYHSLEFTYRSDVPLQVLVEKASVTMWAGKFVANLPANPAGGPVRVRFADLAPAGGQAGRFTGEDVTMIAFYALGDRSRSRSFSLELSDVRFVTGAVTGVEDGPASVTELALSEAAPNPVRDRASIRVAMPTSGRARVTVYDLMGRAVAILHDGDLAAGETRLDLDAATLAAGTYVVRLETPSGNRTRTVTVVR